MAISSIPVFPRIAIKHGLLPAVLFGYLWLFKDAFKPHLTAELAKKLTKIGSPNTIRSALDVLRAENLIDWEVEYLKPTETNNKKITKLRIYKVNTENELLLPIDLKNFDSLTVEQSTVEHSTVERSILDRSKSDLIDLDINNFNLENNNSNSRSIRSTVERSTNDSPNELSPIDSPKQITTISDFETLTVYLNRLNLSSQGFEIYRDILPQFTIPLSGTNRAKTPNGLSGNKPQSMKQALDGLMVLQCSYRLQDLFDGLKNPEKKGDTFRQWANFLNLNREQLDQILPMVWSYLDSKTEDHTWLSNFNNKKPSTNWGYLIAYHLNTWAVKQYRLDNNKLTYKNNAQRTEEAVQRVAQKLGIQITQDQRIIDSVAITQDETNKLTYEQ